MMLLIMFWHDHDKLQMIEDGYITYKDLCHNSRLFKRLNQEVDDANGGEDKGELQR